MKLNISKCLDCKRFKGMPLKFGEKPLCSSYPNGIPQKVYQGLNPCPKKGANNGSRKK